MFRFQHKDFEFLKANGLTISSSYDDVDEAYYINLENRDHVIVECEKISFINDGVLIERIDTFEDYQSQGYGTFFLGLILTSLRDEQIPAVFLAAFPSNSSFYLRLGFYPEELVYISKEEWYKLSLEEKKKHLYMFYNSLWKSNEEQGKFFENGNHDSDTIDMMVDLQSDTAIRYINESMQRAKQQITNNIYGSFEKIKNNSVFNPYPCFSFFAENVPLIKNQKKDAVSPPANLLHEWVNRLGK